MIFLQNYINKRENLFLLTKHWKIKEQKTSHFLHQGIFPAQGLNLHLLCLLHCRQILSLLSHWEIPVIDLTIFNIENVILKFYKLALFIHIKIITYTKSCGKLFVSSEKLWRYPFLAIFPPIFFLLHLTCCPSLFLRCITMIEQVVRL